MRTAFFTSATVNPKKKINKLNSEMKVSEFFISKKSKNTKNCVYNLKKNTRYCIIKWIIGKIRQITGENKWRKR